MEGAGLPIPRLLTIASDGAAAVGGALCRMARSPRLAPALETRTRLP